jgi:hypothetical protein
MMQSRKGSAIETVVNTAVGYAVSVAANAFFLPMFGLRPSFSDSAAIGLIFTGISLVRGYVLRRIFNRLCRN